MTRYGFDYRKRRQWLAWGAKREWPPLNPLPSDPNTYVYISSDHTTDPPPTPVDSTGVVQDYAQTTINTFSWDAIGPEATETRSSLPEGTVSQNDAYIIPIVPSTDFAILSAGWANWAVANGNSCVAVYNAAGTTRLATTGSVANSGTTDWQNASMTNVTLGAGILYWMVYATDSATQQVLRSVADNRDQAGIGIKQQVGAGVALPATLTFADPTNAQVPLFGISCLATI